jgi:23S rRNA (pseudouridine1915-N3)-methyltransferase
MQMQFWTIGKPHEKYVDAGIADFTKRINNYFPASWKIIPSLKNASLHTEQDLKRKEGEIILKMLDQKDYLVTLDEKGKSFSSIQLSSFIQQRANDGMKNIIFLIGGAYGIDAEVLKRANYIWSLSQLTFPHQLVRLILAEQVYRACTILRNEQYHHS